MSGVELKNPKEFQLYDGATGAALAWLAASQVQDIGYKTALESALLTSFRALDGAELAKVVCCLDKLTGDYEGETALSMLRRLANA